MRAPARPRGRLVPSVAAGARPSAALAPGVTAAAAGAIAAIAVSVIASGCAHRPPPPAVPAAEPVTRLEMDPIKISAVSGPDGVHMESYDAGELFEQAGKALSERRFDDAIVVYDRLLREFPAEERFTRPALYNVGLAHKGKKDWTGAIARFKALAEGPTQAVHGKDALFEIGEIYAEMGNWPPSAEIYAQLLARTDLSADDRLEAIGRRGFAQFQLKDLDTAERTFRDALAFFRRIETQERLETDRFLALSQYHLGQVEHERFRLVTLRLPEQQMNADLDEKARHLLAAQRHYIDTIKLGNAGWAAVAGFQVGALYEELYDSFMHAPVPAEYLRPDSREKLDVYYGELRKKIRVLLEKSVRTHEQNLLMMERFGVQGEWRDKSKLAFARIQRLLDPSYRAEFAAPGSVVVPPAAPPLPTTSPSHASPAGAGEGAGAAAAPAGDPTAKPTGNDEKGERERKERPPEPRIRQIL